MRDYKTMGQGQSTKVIAVADFQPDARTITTCPVDAANKVARILTRTDREMPSALYPVAVELDGRPVQARRHLLSVYDQVASGSAPTSLGTEWTDAETLAIELAAVVAGQPAPVVSAIRNEFAEHLAGFDGVLVPARAFHNGYRSGILDLVISGPLSGTDDRWWDYTAGPYGDLRTFQAEEVLPGSGHLATSSELNELVHGLYEAEPARSLDYRQQAMRELEREASADELYVELAIQAEHLIAWVAEHRPGYLDAIRARLSTKSDPES